MGFMKDFDVQMKDNSAAVLSALNSQVDVALEKIGLMAEGYAKRNLTAFPRVDTGRLRGSVSHQVNKGVAYIGTNVSYAPYVEFGTGALTEDETGQVQGNNAWPHAMRPSHFLRNAVKEHTEEYKKVAESALKK